MILERIPFEIIALIYFFMGPYTQSQFGKTCKALHETLKISDDFFENSGVLKVWHSYQIWNMERSESQLKEELARLLFDQPGVKLYAPYLMHGAQPDFDPFADIATPLMVRLSYFPEARPVLNMPKIDPEILALLVSLYPTEMLTERWYGAGNNDFADQCDELLLRSYSLNKRAKYLLKAVFSAHPISLQNLILSCPCRVLYKYLGTGLICTLLKRSRMDRYWHYDLLEDLSPFLTSPEEMELFFRVSDDGSMAITLDLLEKILKFGIPVSEIQRCLDYYSFGLGERMGETSKQVLLHFGAQDEAFMLDFMCQFANIAKRFTWTDDDETSSSALGYSDAFRTRMKELHDACPQDFFPKLKSLFM